MCQGVGCSLITSAKSSTVERVQQDREKERTVGWSGHLQPRQRGEQLAPAAPALSGSRGGFRSPAQLRKMVHSQNASPAAKQPCQDTRSLSLGELEGAQSEWGRVAITLGRLLHSPSEASHPAKQ